MENKQIYIDCIENGGVLYHTDGCRLEFSEGVFSIIFDSRSTAATDVVPFGWSKTEPLKRFDVVWIEREDFASQAVFSLDFECFSVSSDDDLVTMKIYQGKVKKCKLSEIHPNIAKFRERCIKEFGGEK